MTKKTFILIAIASSTWIATAQSSFSATIPAGTTLTVSTVSLISSQTVVGRIFEAKIAQDVAVKGNVVLVYLIFAIALHLLPPTGMT